MSILSIDSIHLQDNVVNVTAVVEDMKLLYYATQYDPEEYCPALCSASFEVDCPIETLEDDDKLIQYLETLDLDWQIVDDN